MVQCILQWNEMLQGVSKMMRKKKSVKFVIRVKFEDKVLKEIKTRHNPDKGEES